MSNHVKTYLSALKLVYPKYDWKQLYLGFGLEGIQAIEKTLREVKNKFPEH